MWSRLSHLKGLQSKEALARYAKGPLCAEYWSVRKRSVWALMCLPCCRLGLDQNARPKEEPTISGATQDETGPKPAMASAHKEACSLVVSGIRAAANEQSLRLLFESAGQVLGCKLVKDEVTGVHKGFGFVMMASVAEAEAGAQKFNNFEVSKHVL